MIPPSFGDLGKGAKDLFDKTFIFGLIKAEHKSKAESGIEIKTTGEHNIDTGKVHCTVETKKSDLPYGSNLTIKWNTNNVLNAELCLEDKVLSGLKHSLNGTLEPNTCTQRVSLKHTYKREYLHLNADLDFASLFPNLNTAAVVGYNGYVAGVQLGLDPKKQALNKFNYAMGYTCKDFGFTGEVSNHLQDFSASVHQKVNDRLESALKVSWNRAAGTTQYAGVAKLLVSRSRNDFMKISLNNALLAGLTYSCVVKSGVRLTLSSNFDFHVMNLGRVGLGFEFES